MAKMEVLNTPCDEKGCDSRATWIVKNDDGLMVGHYCTKHAQTKCRETARAEGKAKS